jgi:hypothetical protein
MKFKYPSGNVYEIKRKPGLECFVDVYKNGELIGFISAHDIHQAVKAGSQ